MRERVRERERERGERENIALCQTFPRDSLMRAGWTPEKEKETSGRQRRMRAQSVILTT